MKVLIKKTKKGRFTVAPLEDCRVNLKRYKPTKTIPRKVLEIGCTLYKETENQLIPICIIQIERHTLKVWKYTEEGKLETEREYNLKKGSPVLEI